MKVDKGKFIKFPENNEALIVLLESILNDAKKKRIHSVVVIALGRDESTYSGYSIHPKHVRPFTLMGYLDFIKQEISERYIER